MAENNEILISFLESIGTSYEQLIKRITYIANRVAADKLNEEELRYFDSENCAQEVFLGLFQKFSSEFIKDNLVNKIIEDKINSGLSSEEAGKSVDALIEKIEHQRFEQLNNEEKTVLKKKIGSYASTYVSNLAMNVIRKIINSRHSGTIDDPKIVLPVVTSFDKKAEENEKIKKYWKIYRKCLSENLQELNEKPFMKKHIKENPETFLTILLKWYFPEDFPVEKEVTPTLDEILEDRRWFGGIPGFLAKMLGISPEAYKKITGEKATSQDEKTRDKIIDFYNISENNVNKNLSDVRKFLREKMTDCMKLNLQS